MGPARSPAVLEIPSPCSAKAEAHWLTPCSLAPAQIIMMSSTQNILCLNSSLSFMPVSPSAIREAMGTLVNTTALTMGINAQNSAMIFQFSMPATRKNRVDRTTTPT